MPAAASMNRRVHRRRRDITVNPVPATPQITGTSSVCEAIRSRLTAAPERYLLLGQTYQWYLDGTPVSDGDSNANYTATSSASSEGTYTVVVTDGGCASAASAGFAVTVNEAPSITRRSGRSVGSCEGGTVVFTASATDPESASLSYQWLLVGSGAISNGPQISGATTNTLTLSNVTAGMSGNQYRLRVRDACGSSTQAVSAPAELTVNANPTPSITLTAGTNPACQGSSITLDAGVYSGYVWESSPDNVTFTPTGDTGQTITKTPLTPTYYRVTVTNATGCVGTDTTFIDVDATPADTIVAADVCEGATGATASLNTGGWSVIAWTITSGGTITSAANGNSITYDVTGSGGGTVDFSVNITNGSGCTTTVTASANINANPSDTIVAADVCEGATGATASLNTGGWSVIAWTITSGGTITGPTNGDSITYDVTGSGGGTVDFSIDLTNGAGCMATVTGSANINTAPSDTIVAADVCEGATGAIASLNTGGWSVTSWTITSGGTITGPTNGDSITYDVTGSGGGTVDFSVDVTNAAGCTATILGSANINANPVDSIVASDVCVGATGATASLNTGGWSVISWTITSGGTITSATNTDSITYDVTGSAGGTVDFSADITNGSGCTATVTGSVNIVGPPSDTIVAADVCEGATGATASLNTGGWSVISWSITSGGTITSATNADSITYDVTGLGGGTVDFSVDLTNGSGCTATITGSANINANPSDTVIAADVCEGAIGATASLNTGGWSVISWSITSARHDHQPDQCRLDHLRRDRLGRRNGRLLGRRHQRLGLHHHGDGKCEHQC